MQNHNAIKALASNINLVILFYTDNDILILRNKQLCLIYLAIWVYAYLIVIIIIIFWIKWINHEFIRNKKVEKYKREQK